MKEYDAYLFDADGTLIDTKELILRSFLHMGEVLGAAFPPELAHGSIGLPVMTQMRLLLGEGKEEAYYEHARDVYNTHLLAHADEYVRAFPGAVEVVGELHRRGKKLAVVTSRRSGSTHTLLRQTGLEQFFSEFVTPECTERHKPHPEPALLALEKLNAKPGETVFIGDAIFDIQCGHAAGTATAFVIWGGMNPAGWEIQPDWTAERFDDLLPDDWKSRKNSGI